MVQTQSYSNVLNMACLLSLREKEQLIRDVQANIRQLRRAHTWEELRAGVQEAEEQIARGEVYSSEEDDKLFDEFISEELGVEL